MHSVTWLSACTSLTETRYVTWPDSCPFCHDSSQPTGTRLTCSSGVFFLYWSEAGATEHVAAAQLLLTSRCLR